MLWTPQKEHHTQPQWIQKKETHTLGCFTDVSGDYTFQHPIKYKSTVAGATFAGLAGIVADGYVATF